MIKTLVAANKSEKVKLKIPRSVQQTIPIKKIYADGTWEVGKKQSRTWQLTDVNYIAASEEAQRSIFMAYCAALNSLPTDATAKITIVNHRLNPAEFERHILLPYKGDWLDHYREEDNAIMRERSLQSNNLVQERFITLSIPEKKNEDSGAYFRRAETNLHKSFTRLGSGLRRINNYQRLRILHDFFRPGQEQYFRYDDERAMRQGKDFKEYICPDGMQFRKDFFEMGDKFGRVLFLRDYPAFLVDSLISELTEFSRNMVLSIDYIPIPTDEALKEAESISLGVDTDITRWQRRQNANGNFSSEVPRNLGQKRDTAREYIDDLTMRDQRMIFSLVTIVHTADDLEQLDADTANIISTGNSKGCTISVARYQQEDGLNTVLPYGLRRLHALNTLTTESCAVAMPFRAQELQDPGGLSYGINTISHNPIICDRKRLTSPHAFYLGVSGSGKSMGMKGTIKNVVLGTDDDVIIIDAEREYGFLGRAFGGEVIEISPHSMHHINPFDIAADYEDNVIAAKSELMTSILEQQMGGTMRGAHKSIIDRCTANVFKPYLSGKQASIPLLTDWRKNVLLQPEPEARDIALAAELITDGSLNVFAHHTDVDISNRITVFDLYDMGEQLRPTALVVTLEFINNRVIENRKKGKFTWVFIDEVYLYFKYHYSAEMLYRAWKRYRKYGGILTAATQNVEECLLSETARMMFANSEFLMLFNQAATDRQELSKLLHIFDSQMAYVTDSEPGHGLLRVEGALIPFDNSIPENTELYALMNTTPGRA